MDWRVVHQSASLLFEAILCFLFSFQILLRFYYGRTEDHLFHKFGPLYVVYHWCGFIGTSIAVARTIIFIIYPNIVNYSFFFSDLISLIVLLACFYTIVTVCAVVNHHLNVFNPSNGPKPQQLTSFIISIWILLALTSIILDILILGFYLSAWWKGMISAIYVLTCFVIICLLHHVDVSLVELFRVITPDSFGFRGIQNEKSSILTPNPSLIQGTKDQNYKRWKVLKSVGQLLAGFAGLLRLIDAGYAIGGAEEAQSERYWLSGALTLFQQIGLFLFCWYAWISPRALIIWCWPDSLLNLRTINDTSETLMVYSSLCSDSQMSVESFRSAKKLSNVTPRQEFSLT